MALTECKFCGKKVSDTTELCIHCGKPLKSEPAIEPEIIEEKEEAPKLKDYACLYPYERSGLEMEFLQQDEKAMKYKRHVNDFDYFSILRSRSLFFFALSFVIMFNVLKLMGMTAGYIESKVVIFTILLGFMISLLGFFLFAQIYIIVAKWIIDRNSLKRFIYMKKYQLWLIKEKSIEYTPILKNLKEKELFNELDLENMDL